MKKSKKSINKEFRKFMMSSKGCIPIEEAIKELNKKYPKIIKKSKN